MGPESNRRESARRLLNAVAAGVLATMSKKKPGYPFASVTPFAFDEGGRPLLLLSALAVHTKNLAESPQVSLFVFEAGADPLNSPRMNIMGTVRPVPEGETAAARERYLERHPDAAEFIDFGDFQLYRLEPDDVYYVGGFGEMGWLSPADLAG